MNRDRIRQPVDDASSSESQDSRPLVAEPHGDLSYSTDSSHAGSSEPALFADRGDGDFRTERVQHNVADVGGARPYDSSETVRPNPVSPGPRPEGRTLRSTSRPIESSHSGLVIANATKFFNRDLMTAAKFTPEERDRINGPTKKDQCIQILEIWKSKGGTSKCLFHLKLLLTDAGGPENKYQSLITKILNCRTS